ncbi:MAG: MFS transporter [Shimia sp.]
MLLAHNRDFRLLFSASAITNLGDGLSVVAVPWLAALLTRDPVLIGLVTAARFAPWALVSLPAGVWTDRADRRALMVRADAVRTLLTLGILALAMRPEIGGALPVAALAGLVFCLGCAEVIRDNAAQTALPAIVAEGDLEAANGQVWTVERVMGEFAGPPLAGLLIAVAVPLPFLFDALSFALAAWLVWAMRLPTRRPRPSGAFWAELAAGIAWLRGHRLLLRFAVVLGLVNALHTGTLTILVLYAQEVLGLGPAGFGLLLTAGAAGGVLGGLAAPRIVAAIGRTRAVRAAFALFVAGYAAQASGALPGVALGLFAVAVGALLWNVVTVSYRQRVIPNDMLGRVNAIYRFFGWGMMPVGAVGAGLLVDLAAPGIGRIAALHLPFAAAAAGSLALAVYGTRRLRFPREG